MKNYNYAVVCRSNKLVTEIGGWVPIRFDRGFTHDVMSGGYTSSEHPVQICNPFRSTWVSEEVFRAVEGFLGDRKPAGFVVIRSVGIDEIRNLCSKLDIAFVVVSPHGEGRTFEERLRVVP